MSVNSLIYPLAAKAGPFMKPPLGLMVHTVTPEKNSDSMPPFMIRAGE